jgi:N-acetylglucosaminyldiphosphoundecaprenol N-acetyl-beta-D-mannosaminyltransferase
MAINAAKLVSMRKDRELAEVIRGCELVSADGQAIVWASRLLGDPLRERGSPAST